MIENPFANKEWRKYWLQLSELWRRKGFPVFKGPGGNPTVVDAKYVEFTNGTVTNLGGGYVQVALDPSDEALEGPGIDIVSKRVGLGGDTILLYDSGGNPVAEYALTALGTVGTADTALGDATSGDAVWLPPGTYAGDHVIGAGVTLLGMGEATALTGTITNNGIINNVKVGSVVILYQNGMTPGVVWDPVNKRLGIGTNAPRRPLHLESTTTYMTGRLASPATEHSTFQLYTKTETGYEGWAANKEADTGDFSLNRDDSEGVAAIKALGIDKETGFMTAYLPGFVRLSDIETHTRFIVTAHRGDINPTDGYPENTVVACLAAAKKGAHRIEIDVRMSSEGTWYLMHDATVDRTTNGTGNVADKTDAQMDALVIDGGYGYSAGRHAGLYHPAKLADVLTALTPFDVTMQIDNKVAADAGTLAEYLAAQGWAQRVAITAYTQAEAQAIKAVSRWMAVIGADVWAETDIRTPAPGLTAAQIEALAPVQVIVTVPITDYNVTDQAVATRDAWGTGARGITTWDIDAALAELNKIAVLDIHTEEADPHTQYQMESEKGAANGYASLDESGNVPEEQLPSSIYLGELLVDDSENILFGDDGDVLYEG